MTVSSNINKTRFLGSNSAGPFQFGFKFYQNEEILVVNMDADGTETALIEGSDYTLSGAGLETGGTINLSEILPTGEELIVYRVLDILQETSFINQGAFYPELHEVAYDKLTMMLQQINTEVTSLDGRQGTTEAIVSAIAPENVVSSQLYAASIKVVPGNYDTLAEAATAADAAGKTVVVTSPHVVTTAIAWPADRELRFEKGGYIDPSSTGTITNLKEVRPEQFGSLSGDASIAFNAMSRIAIPQYNSIKANNTYFWQSPPVIKIKAGSYFFSSTWDLSFRNNLMIECEGKVVLAGDNITTLNGVGGAPAFTYTGNGATKIFSVAGFNPNVGTLLVQVDGYFVPWSYSGGNITLLRTAAPAGGTSIKIWHNVPTIEMVGSSHATVKDLWVYSPRTSSAAIHHSGNGTSEGSAAKDTLAGKGNVTWNTYYSVVVMSNATAMPGPLFDATPYPQDTRNHYYYSMDDSWFYGPQFMSNSGTNVETYAAAFSSGAITIIHPEVSTGKGFWLRQGGNLDVFHPMFSMGGSTDPVTYGALFHVTPEETGSFNSSGGVQLTVYSPYVESTGLPMIYYDPAITTNTSGGSIYIAGGFGHFNSDSQVRYNRRLIQVDKQSPSIDINGFTLLAEGDGTTWNQKVYAPQSVVAISGTSSYVNPSPYVESALISDEKVVLRGGVINGTFAPRILNVTVSSGYVASEPQNYKFRTLDSALAHVNASTASETVITLNNNDTLSLPVNIQGNIRISNFGYTLTIAENATLFVYNGGNLTIGGGTIVNNNTAATGFIYNSGGDVFLNTFTATAGAAGNILVQHRKGSTSLSAFTHTSGVLVDASYVYGSGKVNINGVNTYNSTAKVINTGTGNGTAECTIVAAAAPSTGVWDFAVRTRYLAPTAGGSIGSVCTSSGTPGTWKTYGAVAP